MSEEKAFKYFDTPDGHDTFKKLECLMKPILPSAIGIGLFDIILVSKPKGYLPTIGRLMYVSSPFLAAGATFVFVTNGVASVRNKDDKLNWFLGGFATGTVFGAWRRNAMMGFNLGMAFGFIAFLRKLAAQNNFILFPRMKLRYHDVTIQDWTITKERPGKWVTSE